MATAIAPVTLAPGAFDKQEQVAKVAANLVAGEELYAVFDGKGVGTGFMAITSKRVILQDNSFAGKKVAVTSIPYSQINSVSFVSDKSMFGSFYASATVAIEVGMRSFECEFRGTEKARYIHDYILSRVS